MEINELEQSVNSNAQRLLGNGSQNHHMNAWFEKKGLHITHLNIHYLYPKRDETKCLLSQQNIDILCLCETFLSIEFLDSELNILDYNFIRKDRQTHGGGLIIYTRSNLACIHRDDPEIRDTEILWLEVKNNKQNHYCFATVIDYLQPQLNG